MSTKLLPLLECPFCPSHTGAIRLDPDALAEARAAWPTDSQFLIQRQPRQRIFVFDSGGAGTVPCKHLLELHGDARWRPICGERVMSREWAVDFDWCSGLLEADDPMPELLWHAVELAKVPGLRLHTALSCDTFWQVWPDAGTTRSEGIYAIHGLAVFTEDGERLLGELHQLSASEEGLQEGCVPYVKRQDQGAPDSGAPSTTTAKVKRVPPKDIPRLRPLSRPHLPGIHESLDANKDLEYVFAARDEILDSAVDGYGPDEERAMQLLDTLASASGVEKLKRTAPDIGMPGRLVRAQRHVQANIDILRVRDDVDFALAWRLVGEPEAHLAHSKSMTGAQAMAELRDLIEFHENREEQERK